MIKKTHLIWAGVGVVLLSVLSGKTKAGTPATNDTTPSKPAGTINDIDGRYVAANAKNADGYPPTKVGLFDADTRQLLGTTKPDEFLGTALKWVNWNGRLHIELVTPFNHPIPFKKVLVDAYYVHFI